MSTGVRHYRDDWSRAKATAWSDQGTTSSEIRVRLDCACPSNGRGNPGQGSIDPGARLYPADGAEPDDNFLLEHGSSIKEIGSRFDGVHRSKARGRYMLERGSNCLWSKSRQRTNEHCIKITRIEKDRYPRTNKK